jgi:hypothetical protein
MGYSTVEITPEETRVMWSWLHREKRVRVECPVDPTFEELMLRMGLSAHCDIVLHIARSTEDWSRIITERFLGKPITICPPRTFALDWNDEPKVQSSEKKRRRGRTKKRLDTRVIATAAPNPKKKGSLSWTRYELYKAGARVCDLVDAGLRMEDIRWDEARGFITLRGSAPDDTAA